MKELKIFSKSQELKEDSENKNREHVAFSIEYHEESKCEKTY